MTEQNVSKEEAIGYHKGSINTLMAERNELLKIVGITESLMQAHAQELEKLGVKLPEQDSQTSADQGAKKLP